MEIELNKIYNFIDLIADNAIKPLIMDYYDIILGLVSAESLNWNIYKTRSGDRFINEVRFDENNVYIPDCFNDIHMYVKQIIVELLGIAKLTIKDGSKMIPIQLFICYYRNGNDVCPMHSHKCRQLTLSIGSDRKMKVNTKTHVLYNGSLIYLHKHKHGILKESTRETGNRLSFNLFYTTSNENEGTS